MQRQPLFAGLFKLALGAGVRRATCGAMAAGVVLTAACGDASTDPLATVLTEETQAALTVADDLPTVPERLARAGLTGQEVAEANRLWLRSWKAADGAQALAQRRSAYRMSAPSLARRLSPSQLSEVVADLEEALWAVDRVQEIRSLPPALATAVGHAAEHALTARLALESGDPVRALTEALEGGDHLREVTPERAAARLLDLAEAALRRESGSRTYSSEDRERASRLTRGARQALEGGDHVRAIRRAFYACQLLGVNPASSLTSYGGGH